MMTPQPQPLIQETQQWVSAISLIAHHYRQSFSPGTLEASAQWVADKPIVEKLTSLARLAGLHFTQLDTAQGLSAWRLP